MNPGDDACEMDASLFQAGVFASTANISLYRAQCSNFEKRTGPVLTHEGE